MASADYVGVAHDEEWGGGSRPTATVPRMYMHPRRPCPADIHVGIQLPKDTEHKNTVLLNTEMSEWDGVCPRE